MLTHQRTHVRPRAHTLVRSLAHMHTLQVFQAMLLSKVKGRDVHIGACSALTGDGLREALEWCIKKFQARVGGGGSGGGGGGGAGK